MEEVIKVSSLTKYYGKHRGVEDLTLHVNKGEIYGFIGPNGAGKSTTIRAMVGLLKPTRGSVEIFGLSVKEHQTEILKRIGYMPSETTFYSGMKVSEAIRFSAGLYGKDCREEAGGLCERLKLDNRKKVEELSLGNRKKVGIVCAFQHDADLYILDEPTSGLDPLMQKEFFELVQEKSRCGAAVFLSSHILSEIRRYCHRAAIVKDGRLIVEDDVETICNTSAKRVNIQGVESVPGIEMKDVVRGESSVSFLYNGRMLELIHALNDLPIEDLTITEPDLEEAFLHFYEGGKE